MAINMWRSSRATMEQAGRQAHLRDCRRQPQWSHEALRRRGKIEWIHVRHEEVAAFAAAGEADITASSRSAPAPADPAIST